MDVLHTDFPDEFNATSSLAINVRPPQCSALLDHIFTKSPPDNLSTNLTAYLHFILSQPDQLSISKVQPPNEPLSLLAVRPLLTDFINRLPTISSYDTKVSVAKTAIELIQPRVVSFEEQDAALKYLLASAHEANDDFLLSARTLTSIPLNTSSRTVSDAEKASIWIRIARCYLEESDAVNAAANINKAKQVMHNVQDPELRLNYHLSQARILDSQRNFLDAASAYRNVSYEPLVEEADRLNCLCAAIKCAVLGPAGPLRSRTLAKLYKDDRAAQTGELFTILEKIFLDRMITKEEVESFAADLSEHQKARTADGRTVVERAMLEHNLRGASRIYKNIGIEALGDLLGTNAEQAEQYAAGMIEQGRLTGTIDQIGGRIFFEGQVGAGGRRGKAGGGDFDGTQTEGDATARNKPVHAPTLLDWDANVRSLTEEVEKIATMIQTQYPEFYEENMAL